MRHFTTPDDYISTIIPSDVEIDEVFTLDGDRYKCIEDPIQPNHNDGSSCFKCNVRDHSMCHRYKCSIKERGDKRNIYFKKL